MSLRPFNGETWVAFLDVSGFKQKMKNSLSEAGQLLDKFYNVVYQETSEINESYRNNSPINSLIVSDCAIIYIDNREDNMDPTGERKVTNLKKMLMLIRNINLRLIETHNGSRVMTTCTVDYGEFTYINKKTNEYTAKSYFYGPTYLNVYFENEKLSKTPGFCRILTKNFILTIPQRHELPFKLLSSNENSDYYDYYWMLSDFNQREEFNTEYKNLTQSVFDNLGTLIHDFSHSSNLGV